MEGNGCSHRFSQLSVRIQRQTTEIQSNWSTNQRRHRAKLGRQQSLRLLSMLAGGPILNPSRPIADHERLAACSPLPVEHDISMSCSGLVPCSVLSR